MPDVGRFFNIDPLAEKYTHNSTYAFSENRFIDGRELEGLEWVSSRNLEDKTVNLHLTYKPVNNTMGALSKEQMSTLIKEREVQIVSSFGGKDSNGNTVNISFSQSDKATISWEYNMAYDFSGAEGNDKLSANSRAIYEAMGNGSDLLVFFINETLQRIYVEFNIIKSGHLPALLFLEHKIVVYAIENLFVFQMYW